MLPQKFRVVIVGAGPAGLSTAHALSLAGIDFIILERRSSILVDVGASLVLEPPSLRVMEQFGILHRLLSIGGEIQRGKSFDIDGNELAKSFSIQRMRKNHGIAPVAFHRAQLIETIYDGLSAESKSKIMTGQIITDISTDDKGVSVTCDDGTTYKGSIIIGADGAHSLTRRLMRKQALAHNLTADWDPEFPYTSEYRCLWCSFPSLSESGSNFETQSKNRSVMYISGKQRSWIFLYERLPKSTNERIVYTDEDIKAMAAGFDDYPITEHFKVKDAFERKLTAGMSNLEEGIVERWSFGRMVLVGDACHKFTPNAGLGFNNGIQDIVTLCNSLNKALRDSQDGSLDTAHIESIFQAYQVSRKTDLKAAYQRSAHMTRMHSWSDVPHYIMARIMGKEFVQNILIDFIASRDIRKALVLDYVTGQDSLQGKVTWSHKMRVTS